MNIDFFVVGVARSGTTSIFKYLEQHPEIVSPRKKEPKYFSRSAYEGPLLGKGDSTIKRDVVTSIEEYRDCISLDESGLHGDFSSDYFYHANVVIPQIKKTVSKQPKIIICLRNPYDRAYSAYMNLRRDSREKLDFHDGCAIESERINLGTDWMWHYVNGSLYAERLGRFMREFEQVKVILNGDLAAKPEKVLLEICEFLNIDSKFKFETDVKYSTSGKPRNYIVAALTSRTSPLYPFRRYIQSVIPRWLLEKVARDFLFEKTENLVQWRKEDIRKLNSDIDLLIKLTGNSKLSEWKR